MGAAAAGRAPVRAGRQNPLSRANATVTTTLRAIRYRTISHSWAFHPTMRTGTNAGWPPATCPRSVTERSTSPLLSSHPRWATRSGYLTGNEVTVKCMIEGLILLISVTADVVSRRGQLWVVRKT
jgi:hypothetical protein